MDSLGLGTCARLWGCRRGLEFEPEERVGREGEGVGLRGDGGEGDVAEHLDGTMPAKRARSRETGWAKRERLATQRTVSLLPSSS